MIILNVNCQFQKITKPTCPENSSETKYFRDYADCTKYYECINKEAVSKKCKDDLYWNDKKLVNNWSFTYDEQANNFNKIR